MQNILHNIRRPAVIGHRGYRARYPENTLASFSAAIAAGADMIELDVTLSKDDRVVVIHDDNLDRTSSGRGKVRQTPLEILKTLDTGSWFDPSFSGETLPTLEEVLDLAGSSILINIEIKSSAWNPFFQNEAIERQIVRLVAEKQMQESVLISSFQTGFLERIVQLPHHPEVALISGQPVPQGIVETCKRLGGFSWHPCFQSLEQNLIHQMHQAGIRIFPYTVNHAEDMLLLMNMGVDGIFTDDPSEMIRRMSSH